MNVAPYSIECYHSIDDVPALFDSLFEQTAKQSVFCSRNWFSLLEQNVFQHSVIIFTVSSNDAVPLLVLPCYEVEAKGKHLHSLANYYSALFMPVYASDYAQPGDLFNALFKEINRYNYQSITLQPMDNGSVDYVMLMQSLKQNGYFTEPFFCFANWYEILGSALFSDYYQHRPSKLTNTIRRKEKKLTDLQIVITSDYEQIKQLYPSYKDIYSSSWKVEESHPLFIEQMVFSLARNRQLRFGLAYIADKPAAAQLWFISKGISEQSVASIYKLAYDPFFKSTSIGSILTKAMFEHVIEKEHVKIIDYLSGDDAYKKDWVTNRRERWGIIAYNRRSLSGFIAGFKAILAQWVKKVLVNC